MSSSRTAVAFDGVDGSRVQPPERLARGYNPVAFPRRLTPAALNTLRQRRTGVGRGVQRPLQRRHRANGYATDESGSDDDDGEEEEESIASIICCCWGPRCCVATFMLVVALIIWSAAISYGILKVLSLSPSALGESRWQLTDVGYALPPRAPLCSQRPMRKS